MKRSLLPLAALAVLLAAPAAVRAQQTLYFTTFTGNIDKVNPDGSVSTVQTFTNNSKTDSLRGLAFDGSNLFAAARDANVIYRVNPATGIASTFVALPAGSNGQQLVLGPGGNLYVAAYNLNQVDQITPGGVVSTFATLPTGSNPAGLAFDTGGNLFVANSSTNNISRVDALTGSVTTFATLAANTTPIGLAFDQNGSLYVAGGSSNQILKLSADGSTASPFVTLNPTVGGAQAGQNPYGILFGPDGNLDIAEGDRIGVYDASGAFVTSYRTPGTGPNFLAFVPEPSTWLGAALLGGLGALGAARRLRRA